MTQKIGDSASAARTAIESALRRHAEASARVREAALTETQSVKGSDFKSALMKGIEEMDANAKSPDSMVNEVVTGNTTDFHAVALRLKESELSFRYSMEVRNKFVDAYREIMRMSV